jgi:trehalose utilization protein
MYGEFFDIPPPDELVFVTSFEGGEVFRSGCCWHRGLGRLAYFSPGDQEFPVYHQPEVQRVIANCVAWAGGRATPNDLPSARQGKSPRNWYM